MKINAVAGPLLVACLLLASPALADDRLPHDIVEQEAGYVLSQLNSRHAEFKNDPSLLENIVRNDITPLFDLHFTARLILGRPGRGASDEQVDAFTAAVTDQLIDRYTQGLLQFRSEDQLDVLPLRGDMDNRATTVQTRVKLTNGSYAPVDYVFRNTDAGWKAFDVIVEGISYVRTYREQIGPRVQSQGIDAVTAEIRAGAIELNEG